MLAACRDATAQLTRVAAEGDSHLAPLVFLLQSNGVKPPGGLEQAFLDELHRVQREEIGFRARNEAGIDGTGRSTEQRGESDGGGDDTQLGNGGKNICDNEGRGVFLVGDVGSNLQRNRPSASSEHREHTKFAGGKILWNLIALVDREHSLSPARSQANRNETLEARERDLDASSGSYLLVADAVWSRLQAAASQDECLSPPCDNVSTTVTVFAPSTCFLPSLK